MNHPNPRINLYYQLLRIRRVEEEISRRYLEQEMRCPTHLSIGQEATSVAISSFLSKDDDVFSSHRSHAHYLSKGGCLKSLIAEMYGREAGCAKGHGGSMHLIDIQAGFQGATSIVGGTIPVAVGNAWARKLSNQSYLTVSYFGDAAVEEGVFHESLNFSSVHKIPIIFVCEDNGYSCYTPLELRQPNRPFENLAKAHDINFLSLNGEDLFEMVEKLALTFKKLREKPGPLFIHSKSLRHLEHCGPNNDDHLNYRTNNEIDEREKRDCLMIARKKLSDEVDNFEELEISFIEKIKTEINEAFDFALNSSFPNTSVLGSITYAK